VARKKQPPISDEDRQLVGRLLREVRRGAGYRAVESAAAVSGCPAARQTIYAYERGGFTPSLAQFLELVEFYVLEAPVRGDGAKADEDLRAQGVAAVTQALTLREAKYPAVQYIPRKDVDMSLLQRTDHATYCPYKGDCAYYSIPSGGERSTNAVWTYEAPYAAVAEIKDHLAFYPHRVDEIKEQGEA
jgi:uncharacterized protein (DUF427 family)/DNA-binding XRE family transcriptional regulator